MHTHQNSTPALLETRQSKIQTDMKKKIVFLHIYMNKKSKRRIKWRACDFYEQSSMQCSSHQCSEAASTPKTVCACPIFMHDNNTLMKAQWDSIAQSLWELSVIKWLKKQKLLCVCFETHYSAKLVRIKCDKMASKQNKKLLCSGFNFDFFFFFFMWRRRDLHSDVQSHVKQKKLICWKTTPPPWIPLKK